MENKFPARNWIKTVPIDYLTDLGYNPQELHCDICDKKLRPTIFEKSGFKVIKNAYFFENKIKGLSFLACKNHRSHKRIGTTWINSFFNDDTEDETELVKFNKIDEIELIDFNKMMKFISRIINGPSESWLIEQTLI